jgi:hypothetical protein
MVSRFREKLSSEKLADRVARMQLDFDRATGVVTGAAQQQAFGTQLDLLDD